MITIAILMVLAASSRVVLDETCHQLNPGSAIDQAFVEALPASGIPYKMEKGMPCFADADESRVAALKSKVEGERPHTCLTFEKAWNVPAVEEKLHAASVPVWRLNTNQAGRITICHLDRDKAKVKSAIQAVFPDLK